METSGVMSHVVNLEIVTAENTTSGSFSRKNERRASFLLSIFAGRKHTGDRCLAIHFRLRDFNYN